jgi:hypothetical protein
MRNLTRILVGAWLLWSIGTTTIDGESRHRVTQIGPTNATEDACQANKAAVEKIERKGPSKWIALRFLCLPEGVTLGAIERAKR